MGDFESVVPVVVAIIQLAVAVAGSGCAAAPDLY